jgi:P27 family predicted phage terminase small subunit
MAPPGRAPFPTKLKLLRGNHLERVNAHEPVPRAALPVLPDDASDEVRDVWDRVLPELIAMGLAHAADQDALRCYCEAVVTHRKACRLLATSGVIIPGLHGGPVRNPALAVQRDAAFAIRTFAGEFGLTPSARSRIDTGVRHLDEEANPFAGTG